MIYPLFFSDIFTSDDAVFHGLSFGRIKSLVDLPFYVSRIEILEKMKPFLVGKYSTGSFSFTYRCLWKLEKHMG
jgi:hypothetical protein